MWNDLRKKTCLSLKLLMREIYMLLCDKHILNKYFVPSYKPHLFIQVRGNGGIFMCLRWCQLAPLLKFSKTDWQTDKNMPLIFNLRSTKIRAFYTYKAYYIYNIWLQLLLFKVQCPCGLNTMILTHHMVKVEK